MSGFICLSLINKDTKIKQNANHRAQHTLDDLIQKFNFKATIKIFVNY